MNYSELKTNIAYTHRGDLAAMVDTFIDLFEARVNRVLRTVEMESNSVVTPVDEFVDFPTDFLELKSIRINGSSKRILEYRSPAQVDALGITGGIPNYYTIRDGKIQIAPSGVGYEVELFYFSKITDLSDVDTTNWLIESHPDYYMTGMLNQAYLYVKDGNNAAMTEQKLQLIEQEIKRCDRTKRYGSGPMVITTN